MIDIPNDYIFVLRRSELKIFIMAVVGHRIKAWTESSLTDRLSPPQQGKIKVSKLTRDYLRKG